MARDRFPGNLPNPDETLHPSQFRVEIPNPEGLAEVIDGFADLVRSGLTPQGRENRPIVLEYIYPDSGLFSGLRIHLIYTEDADGFTMDLVAPYRDSGMQVWNSDELTQVEHLLSGQYAVQNVSLAIVEEEKLITINNPVHGITFSAFMGLEFNDRQVNLRSEGNVTFMDFHEEETPGLFMTAHAIGVDDVYDLYSPLSLPKSNPELFAQRMNSWKQAMERVVNTAAQVKGMPQTGTLILPSPSLL